MKITEEIKVEEEYSNHPEDKSKEKEEECEKKEKNPKITKFYEEETISTKETNNDEPNVTKKKKNIQRKELMRNLRCSKKKLKMNSKWPKKDL